MLGIQFLREGKLSGLEFMDFQSSNFAKELVEAIEPHITINRAEEDMLSSTVGDEILPIIEKYTGFKNITIKMMDEANFAVDVAYLSPNNILNMSGIENWIDTQDSNLSKWYASNKNKIFKGSIDYTKGKVSGAYAELPIVLYLGKPVHQLFSRKEVAKLQVPLSEMIAGCIAHELGHCFTACSTIDITANDNFVIRAALGALGATNTKEKRLTIIRSTASLLEASIEGKDNVEAIADKEDLGPEILIYFNALVSRRNTSRALSLGVAEMSSEVLADMYAIRMGFDRGIVATVSILSKTRVSTIFSAVGIVLFFISLIFAQFLLVAPLLYLMIVGGFTLMSTFFIYGVMSYSGGYNSPFRRYEDAIRQIIAKIKEVEMPAKDKLMLAERAARMLKECEALRPIIQGTVFDRLVGRMIQGADFKYQEFEHYSQAIANSELEILNARLGDLTV